MNGFNKFIQIAGVSDNREAQLLIKSGVKFLGFPFRLPVNKEDITEADAAKIIKKLPPSVHGILITYLNNAREIINLCKKLGVNIVQLHGEIELRELAKVKKINPEIIIIKSLIVGKHNLSELKKIIDLQSNYVNAYITDTYNPVSGATGATGITHDWEISKALVNHSNKPVILAGGLTPENVYNAIITVKPAGVDAHTGVEDSFGKKDKNKIKRFLSEAEKGFNKIQGEQ
jgi:phosphoribosylanthranilate isomerase